jgi:uncharacterized protein YjbI with pentapeptide repeats
VRLLNQTPFAAALLPGPTPMGGGLTMVVKGSFAPRPSGVAQLLEPNARPLLSGTVSWQEDPSGRTCRYPSDLVPWKPRADVLVLATLGHGERQARQLQLKLGPLTKRIEVAPAEFGHRVMSLAPLAPPDAARLAASGTYDAAWRNHRWPWFPKDFDWSLFNAAARDQQVDGFLAGDERLQLDGLSEERFDTTLPSLRPRGFIRRGADAEVLEVPLVLDTLWLDAPANELVLVWRGVLAGSVNEKTQALVAVEALSDPPLPVRDYALETRWADTTHGSVVDRGSNLAAAPEEVVDRAEPSAASSLPSATEAAEEAESIAECLQVLREANVPADLLTRAANATSLSALVAILGAELPRSATPLDDLDASVAMAKQFLLAHGQDPSILDPEESRPAMADSEASPPWTRERVAAQGTFAGSLAGADLRGLDLSALDLSNVNLSRALLDGANLTGTIFLAADLTDASLKHARADSARFDVAVAERAKFDGVSARQASFLGTNLGNAKLPNTDLSAARLDGADLTGALLTGAKLEGASLLDADASGAELQLAVFRGATAARILLRKADLTGADLTGANLEGANLSDASLTRARLEDARLVGARLEGARGEDVSFARADLTKARAGKACSFPKGNFREVTADGAIWTDAELAGANFEQASLVRASFRGARLKGASLHLTNLQHVDFSNAQLAVAKLSGANAFQALFPGADLTDADCQGSNFYECEFWQATSTGARFDRSILTRTKLAPEKSP